jgi:hypothetical protein
MHVFLLQAGEYHIPELTVPLVLQDEVNDLLTS